MLARRGLGDPSAARAFLAADERHDPSAFAGIDAAVALVLRHVQERSRITVHGDYDVDGVTSTAILVGLLRRLGADVDWFLPSRQEDGYGLQAATVERLAARGTRLLVTADCAITAVDEVALARERGMDVVVTDHHSPRADGRLPDAPTVHPALSGYPCAELCAAGVVHKLAGALLAAAGRDPAEADADLDLVALATIADCVPLLGENRRLVREGVRALAATRRPGLRALMRVAQLDPGCVDARSVAFRLAPRINAAGRLHRADAGVELLLTEDPERAAQIADELDHANAERRIVEQRILFAAEAQVAALGEQPAYVLAGEDWHPGVIGIVASRIVERTHRPAVLVALRGEEGTGSGRSIDGFDLLGGLDASAEHLLRHGGHRAAAGCTVRADAVDAFRAAFVAHAQAVLRPEDLVARERVDAIVAGDELGLDLCESLAALGPFGQANPVPSVLVPAARLTDPRPMGEEGRHLRFTVQAGGVRARGIAFGRATLPAEAETAVDATFDVERNEFRGAVEARLLLRKLASCEDHAGIRLVGEPADWRAGVVAAAGTAPPAWPADLALPPGARDRRDGGVAGTIAALVGSGEPVLVVAADAATRRGQLAGRLGGFALTSWHAVERDAAFADGFAHAVALDPPPHPSLVALVGGAGTGRAAHLAWGPAELAFAWDVHRHLHVLREPLIAVYRALREGRDLASALRGDGQRPRHPVLAGRLLAVLVELGLVVDLDEAALTGVLREPDGRLDLDAAPTSRACAARLAEAQPWLTPAAIVAAAA